jgi:LPS-assembly lipoprotein
MKKAWLLVMVCVLASCGYHLRGSQSEPLRVSSVVLKGQTPDSLFFRRLQQAFRQLSVPQVQRAEKDSWLITVSTDKLSREVLSVDQQGRANRFFLKYHVALQLQREESPVNRSTHIHLQRSFSVNPESWQALQSEETRLHEEMVVEAISRVMTLLGSEL